jgi:hypothetical protein
MTQITDIAQAGGFRSMAHELGGLAWMLDQDGNGNPLDDIPRKVEEMSR